MQVPDESSTIKAIEKVSKSVVNVSTIKLVHDILLQATPVKGIGSGTIISSKGYVLTNYHVIEGAERIVVTLADGRPAEGKLIGTYPSADIAVVKIDVGEVPEAELGDSDELKVGQTVYAIGNPLGLAGGPAVTTGVISALNRSIRWERGILENLIQTDAAINFGNSGGPLVDVNGKVIAINTAIIPFAQGIGFAIPINLAKKCADDLIAYGKVLMPWLGISGISVTEAVAAHCSLRVKRGVLVVGVSAGSPADQARVAEGDVILELNGAAINTIEDLRRGIQRRNIGEEVKLTILRDAKKRILRITLMEIP
jgi:S1-C subfamily serine protease